MQVGNSVNAEIKDSIKKQYAKIALTGNSECCCMPGECSSIISSSSGGGGHAGVNNNNNSPSQVAQVLGYNPKELESIPEASILGVGCGAPINFTDLKEGEIVVDLGSGAGIDVFLSANKVGYKGKVIGIDMTDEMLEKARNNAVKHGYRNVEFRKGDIENQIPVDNDSVDVVVSNCVINLTSNKVKAFQEINRILREGGRMVISDLVTDGEVKPEEVNVEKWCSCIDGALTKEHYIDSIKEAGFKNIEVLQEKLYLEEEDHQHSAENRRKITSIVVKGVKTAR
jgi:ubiquinone/menaquinone biosynthesis C-methylase UbiE